MSEIKVDTLTGKTTAKTVTVTVGATATQSLEQGLVKAWVNYDATAITDPASLTGVLDSVNIASILDEGAGFSAIAFTNVFNNTYHVLSSSCNVSLSAAMGRMVCPIQSLSTSQVQTRTFLTSTLASIDGKSVQCSINGDLA
jgi:hypothetical protein